MAQETSTDLRPLLEYYISAGAHAVAREILERLRTTPGDARAASGDLEFRILSAEVSLLATEFEAGHSQPELPSDAVDQIEALVDAVHLCPEPERIAPAYRERILVLDVLLREHRGEYDLVLEKIGCICASHDVNPARAVGLYLTAARACERLGRVGDVEMWLHRALAAAKASHSIERQGRALAALGYHLTREERTSEALPLMLAALELQTRAGQWRGAARIRLALARIYRGQGRLREALRLSEEAEAVSDELNSLHARLEAGFLCILLKRYDAARATLLRSWGRARTGSPDVRLRFYALLALAGAKARRAAPARVALSLAKRWLTAASCSVDGRAESGIHLATALIALGQIEPAAELLQELSRLPEQRLGFTLRAARHHLRGEIRLAARDWRSAAAEFARAGELNRRSGNLYGASLAQLALGRTRLCLARSDEERAAALELTSLGAEGLRRCGVPPERVCGDRPRAQFRGSRRVEAPITDDLKQWTTHGIITRSRRFHRELLHAAQVAPIDLPVLIHGETGAGKELVARVIHRLSGRMGRFVVFNAASCTSELFEAELFGHRRGAFTGAHRDRAGVIAQAQQGTLFLDETAELSPVAQAILLRFLDRGEVRPVGADAPHTIHTRIVAATHRRLRDLVDHGHFRQDLYFRLAGTEIQIPPLRARSEDVLILTRHFAAERGMPAAVLERLLASELGDRLRRYAWPGNVRQLKHLIEHLAALVRAGAPVQEIRRAVNRALSLTGETGVSPRLRRVGERQVSREKLLELLQRHGGNISHVARELQTYRTHVYRLIKKRGIDLCRYRQ